MSDPLGLTPLLQYTPHYKPKLCLNSLCQVSDPEGQTPIATPTMSLPPITISAFYKFVTIDDCEALRVSLLDLCQRHGIKGTILLATEGINGTISGRAEDLRAVLAALRSDARFAGLVTKESYAGDHPFQRLKVKIKPEIVTFGAPEADPSLHVGTYVAPQNWNALINQPDVVVIDTRNAYEVVIGSFPGALDPQTKAFSEFQDFAKSHLNPGQHPKVAMFCTGGIRCEKASAYLLSLGFPEVYHLEGGILKYLETVPPEQSLWQGECFVFDERVALEHGVQPGTHRPCPDCGFPLSAAGNIEAQCPNCS